MWWDEKFKALPGLHFGNSLFWQLLPQVPRGRCTGRHRQKVDCLGHLPASCALLSPLPRPGVRVQSQKCPAFSPFSPLPHRAPSLCTNHASVRIVGPQTSSSLVLGLGSSVLTPLAHLVKTPRVLDLKGPQELPGHGLALDPDYPQPLLGTVAR